jgi:hypothetical protein
MAIPDYSISRNNLHMVGQMKVEITIARKIIIEYMRIGSFRECHSISADSTKICGKFILQMFFCEKRSVMFLEEPLH